MTDREYMLEALRAHGAIRIYRRNSGAARIANDLAVEGLVCMTIVQEDEQSSYLLVEMNEKED
jgi:hypothetical protein